MTTTNENKSFVPGVSDEILARLLATENLHVVHRSDLRTAAIDLKSRTLFLPVWKDITKEIYTTFCCHEVAHALYSPVQDPADLQQYPDITNMVEDARINKLIQRRFPGIGKDFTVGCRQLFEKNLYGTQGQDLNTFGLVDRLNLYFKLDYLNRVIVPFADDEKKFIKMIVDAETAEDTQQVSRELIKFLKENRSSQSKRKADNSQPQSGSPGQGEQGESAEEGDDYDEQEASIEPKSGSQGNSDKKESKKNDSSSDKGSDEKSKKDSSKESSSKESDSKEESEKKSESKKEAKKGDSSQNSSEKPDLNKNPEKGDFNSKTRATYEKNMNNFVDVNRDRYSQIEHCNIPDVDSSFFIDDYKQVLSEWSDHIQKHANSPDGSWIVTAGKALTEFHRNNDKAIAYMVKEFEMKKAADTHKRQCVAKTGILNMDKIHSFKYNDDIFLRSLRLQEGKNHGLVVFMDCSGSMDMVFADVIEQLLNLVFFCRKVGIPFEMYGFRNNSVRSSYGYNTIAEKNRKPFIQTQKENDIAVQSLNLRNYFSSRMNSSEFRTQCLNMMLLWGTYKGTINFSYPVKEGLSYTPLDDTIVVAHDLVKKFRERTRSQIVNVVFLTDGESYPSAVIFKKNSYGGGYYTQAVNRNDAKLTRMTRKNRHFFEQYDSSSSARYSTNRMYSVVTRNLLESLKSETGTRVIGFYVLPKYSVCSKRTGKYSKGHTTRNLPFMEARQRQENALKFVQSDGCITVKNLAGYDSLCIYASRSSAEEKSFSLDPGVKLKLKEGLTKGTIKKLAKSFNANLQSKMYNRIILTGFIQEISGKTQ